MYIIKDLLYAKCIQINVQLIRFFPNSAEISILAMKNPGATKESFQWAAVKEITDSCHTESCGRHRRRRTSIWNQRKERAGAMVGQLPRTKNVLLQGGMKYRFDLSNGKSYHLHTTGLFTPSLWLKCELNHRTLQPPGDFAHRFLSPPPYVLHPPIQGLSTFSFPTTSQRKLENQKDNAWRGLLLLRGDREARYDEEK